MADIDLKSFCELYTKKLVLPLWEGLTGEKPKEWAEGIMARIGKGRIGVTKEKPGGTADGWLKAATVENNEGKLALVEIGYNQDGGGGFIRDIPYIKLRLEGTLQEIFYQFVEKIVMEDKPNDTVMWQLRLLFKQAEFKQIGGRENLFAIKWF